MIPANVAPAHGDLVDQALRRLAIDNCPVCARAPLSISTAPIAFTCERGCDSLRVAEAVGQAARSLHGDALRAEREALEALVAAALAANEGVPANDVVPEPVTRSVPAEAAQPPMWPAPLHSAALHGLAGRIVTTIEPHTEADPVALLFQLLAAFGNAIGRGPYFAVEASKHYTNINVVLVGQTSKARKGTSWEHIKGIMKITDEAWSSTAVISGLSSGEGLISHVRDARTGKEAIRERSGRITEYQDAIIDEGVTDKRAMVQEPEFARVLRVAARDGNTLSAVIREAWDTGNLRVITKNSPTSATNAQISIVAHSTKEELLQHIRDVEVANGFANRFLWVAVCRSKYLPEGGARVGLEALADELRAALAFARGLGDRPIERDAEAAEIWRSVYPKLSGEREGMLGAILGRAEAQVTRLSLIYALLDRSEAVRAVHLRAALALMEFVERSVAYIFGTMTGIALADEILDFLRDAPTGLTRTEISAHLGRHTPRGQLNVALDCLLRRRLAYRLRQGTAGRTSERWFAVTSEEGERSRISASSAVVDGHSSLPSHAGEDLHE